MNKCSMIISAMAMMAASSLLATDFWVKSDSSGHINWAAKESYYTTSAGTTTPETDPTKDDYILLPDGIKVTVEDDDTAFLSNVKRIILLTGAELTIKVSTNTTWSGAIYNGDSSYNRVADYTAKVVKKGEGKLTLGCCNETQTSSNSEIYDYFTSFDVQEGSIEGVTAPSSSTKRYCRNINVAKDANFYLGNGGGFLYVWGSITGEGCIRNDSGIQTQMNIYAYPTKNKVNYCHFDGEIHGNIYLWVMGCRVDFTGTNSTFRAVTTGHQIVLDDYGARSPGVGFATMGWNSDAAHSSLGINQSLYQQYPGTIYNLGLPDGSATSGGKGGSVNGSGAIYDGGTNGNWTYTGLIAQDSAFRKIGRVYFQGSNLVNECVFKGTLRDETEKNDASHHTGFRIVKRGPGIWRFADTTSNNGTGVYEVQDGTLKFDTIAEKGTRCSLGYATYTYADYVGAYDASKLVDYAYVLGATNGNVATFQYTGTSDAVVTNRKVAIQGDARIKCDNGNLDLTGFGAIVETNVTLRLAGSAANCVARDITNGVGKLSVVKEDAGTWRLQGEQSFSGKLEVKGGHLKIGSQMRYEYYRLVIKANEANSGMTEVEEIALYDGEGKRRNYNFTYDDSYGGVDKGKFQMYLEETSGSRTGASRDHLDTTIVDDSVERVLYRGGPDTSINSVQFTSTPLEATTSSWIYVEFHMPDDCPAIESYDMSMAYGVQRRVKLWELQGSNDDKNWVTLDETPSDFVMPTTSYCWYGAGTTHKTGVEAAGTAHTGGFACDWYDDIDYLKNVETIQVAAGATLSTDQDLVISNFTVAADEAVGTVSGFTLAENGTINYVGTKPKVKTLLEGLSGVAGYENLANWTFKINGKRTSAKLEIEEDSVYLKPFGGVLVFR